MVAASFYGLLIYLSWHNVQTGGCITFFLSCLMLNYFMIGCSRIYLHVHFATDVMAGFRCRFSVGYSGRLRLKKTGTYSKRNLNPMVEEAAIKAE
jgi:hypothetical protein